MKTTLTIAFILISSLCYAGTIVVKIGEDVTIGELGWNKNTVRFVYCGMPNEKVFSIKSSHGRSSVNLYYPISTKEIKPDWNRDVTCKVVEVSQMDIKLYCK